MSSADTRRGTLWLSRRVARPPLSLSERHVFGKDYAVQEIIISQNWPTA